MAKSVTKKSPATQKASTATEAPAEKKAAVGGNKAQGKGGVAFKDPGFRLAVINALLELGHFGEELEAAQDDGGEADSYEIDPEVERAVNGFVLTPELLAKVTSLAPDGGDDIYEALMPEWDGESDEFDIQSLEDVRLLPNLERVVLFSMCKQGIDLTPLGDVPKLKEVQTSFVESWATGVDVLPVLQKRGVTVKVLG